MFSKLLKFVLAVLSFCALLYAQVYAQVPQSNHVVIVAEENHPYTSIIGNTNMPYINGLANKYGLATGYYANAHPSIGNYFMLTAGQLITVNDKFANTLSQDNLVRQMIAFGKTWRSYSESIPSNGYTGNDSFPYIRRHNPFSYYSDVVNDSVQKQKLVAAPQFLTDVQNNSLPNLSMLVPNAQNDGHDCPAGMSTCTDTDKLVAMDNWLKQYLDPLLATPAFQPGGDGLLIIWFDEANASNLVNGGGKVPLLLIGPKVKAAFKSSKFYQHESVLKTLLQSLNIPQMLAASKMAPEMSEFFTNAPVNTLPVTSTLSSTYFGIVPVNTVSAPVSITVKNTQAVSLDISQISVSGEYSQTNNCPSSLSAGATCVVNVSFAPKGNDFRPGLLTISDNATTSPQQIYLGGAGRSTLTLSPASLAFGDQTVGTVSASKGLTIANSQSTAVNISSISSSADFSQTNNCPATLAAAASCTVSVSFSPSSAGPVSGTLTVQSDAPGSPHTAALSGNGLSSTGTGLTVVYRINTGGPSYTDSKGQPWRADGFYNTGNISSNTNTITGTSDPTLFHTERYDATTAPELQYSLPVSTGTYRVNMYFAETYSGAQKVGGRVFNVLAEGQTVLANLDIYAAAGANAALMRSFDVPVTDGALTLDFQHNIQNPKVNAIEVFRVSTSTSTPTAVLSATPTSGPAPLTVRFDGSSSTDPGGSITNYAWDFGDGTTGGGTTVSHTYSRVGKYTASLTVTDNSGARDVAFQLISAEGTLKTSIQHIIIFAQENRSFDNYFGRLGAYRASKGFTDAFDGVPLNVSLLNAAGQPTSPFPFQTVCHDNLSAGWNTQHTEVDGGKMDLFIRSRYLGSTNDPNYTRGIGYYDEKDLPYYYELATQFAVSDRFFSSLLGPTNPNRFYLFSASSFGNVAGSTPPPAGGFTYPTIFDKLDAAGISWRMYYYDTSHLFLQSWANWWKWKANVFPISQYYLDVQSESTFPQFVFIERGGGVDEHPGADIDFGARNTKTYIDALMASPVWQSTVFFLTFDEGGGMYDHVYPPAMVAPDNIQPILSGGDTFMAGFTQAGLRIPLVVISPWVKPHYVSHVNRDLTALLKFVETRFNLTPLSNRDAAQDDMTEMFNFSAPFFATPPKLPAQNALHGCDFSLGKAPGQ